MRELFRNNSPGALTRAQAVEIAKQQAQAERAERRRMAENLARQGRGEDTEIAHVARGELVIPEVLQVPEVLKALRRATSDAGVSLDRLRVGGAHNSINPSTGMPEFANEATSQPLPVVGSFGRDNMMSAEGRDILKRREVPGGIPVTHNDLGGNLTTGYGYKGPLTKPPQEQFDENVAWADKAVNDFVKVPLTQAEHDALSSLVYNIGRKGFANSDMPGLLNRGDFLGAADNFRNFDKFKKNGVYHANDGLANRGNDQRDQFLSQTLNVTASRLP